MILDLETFKTNMVGLVGMHQTNNPDYPNLDNSLLTSSSGFYVQDVAPGILTIENIDQSLPNFSQFNYTAYDNSTEYSQWDRVSQSGVNYVYINATASTGNAPPDATYWEAVDDLSDYLTRAYKQAVADVINDYLTEKKIKKQVKAVFDRIQLYTGVAHFRDVEPNADNFVGLRLALKRDSPSLMAIINKIGTQFNAALTSPLTIYVYHSSDHRNAIASFNITHGVADKHIWTAPSSNLYLRHTDGDRSGGEYYIGYKQSDLAARGGQSLRMYSLDWRREPCGTCDRRWQSFYQQYSPFVDVMAFEIPETSMMGTDNFEPDGLPLVPDNNYGLNLDMSLECDLATYFLQEKDVFARAIQLRWALNLMKQIATNSRTENKTANNVRQMAKEQLYTHNNAKGTVQDDYKDALASLQFDMSSLDDVCLPCDDEDGGALIQGYVR